MLSKNSTTSKNFYLSILDELEKTTDLTKIQNKLSISKQKLNYYLREMKKKGIVIHKGRGWYEIAKGSKNSTNHEIHLTKDSIRGHAYVWTIKLPKEIEGWKDRIKKLEEKKIHFILVGAKENTPRIKVLGRKVWLCNDSIRIYDKKNMSYYGKNAIESRKLAFREFLLIVDTLERKLGLNLKKYQFEWNKEHYALIKNDLATEENKKGNLWHIRDEKGEWLVIDDSLSKGGELENNGKNSFETNIFMSQWWNENKKDNFQTTKPENIKSKFKEIDSNFNEVTNRIKVSSEIMINSELRIKQMESNVRGLTETVYQLIEVIKDFKNGNSTNKNN